MAGTVFFITTAPLIGNRMAVPVVSRMAFHRNVSMRKPSVDTAPLIWPSNVDPVKPDQDALKMGISVVDFPPNA